MILGLQQGLAEDGVVVSLVKLCQWFQSKQTANPTLQSCEPRPR